MLLQMSLAIEEERKLQGEIIDDLVSRRHKGQRLTAMIATRREGVLHITWYRRLCAQQQEWSDPQRSLPEPPCMHIPVAFAVAPCAFKTQMFIACPGGHARLRLLPASACIHPPPPRDALSPILCTPWVACIASHLASPRHMHGTTAEVMNHKR